MIMKNKTFDWKEYLIKKYLKHKVTNPKEDFYKINGEKNLKFIHIGKCGGSFIRRIRVNNKKIDFIHRKKPEFNSNEKYLIWIRNPISRFVSAFHCKFIPVFYFHSAPAMIKRKLAQKGDFLISDKYDIPMLFFKTPNALAESLTSKNSETKNMAREMMNFESFGHIYRSIGWYLDNGDFITNHNKNIFFVGRQEYMEEDLKKFADKLDVKLKIPKKKVNESADPHCSNNLSPLAIKNILHFYKNSDYKALKELYNHRWIDKKTLDSYSTYSHKQKNKEFDWGKYIRRKQKIALTKLQSIEKKFDSPLIKTGCSSDPNNHYGN